MLTLADLTPLEIITYRAALALQFADAITGERVSDGLAVHAYAFDPANPQLARRVDAAEKSPNSGVYGFRSLPGLERYGIGDPVAAGSLSFIVTVVDRLNRYLPQTHRYDLPFANPAVQLLHLYSAPTRPGPTGYGAVRVQILRTTDPTPPRVTVLGPAAWARLILNLPGGSPDFFEAFADSRGTLLALVPYPVLADGVLLNETEWTITANVAHQPAVLESDYELLEQVMPHLDHTQTPPFQATLQGQADANLYGTVTIVDAVAGVYDLVGPANNTALDFTLRFGRPLALRTQNSASANQPLSELLVNSA